MDQGLRTYDVKTSVPVRLAKLSKVEANQYRDGWPVFANSRCCKLGFTHGVMNNGSEFLTGGHSTNSTLFHYIHIRANIFGKRYQFTSSPPDMG